MSDFLITNSTPTQIYSNNKMERLFSQSLKVLEEIGCSVDHDDLLEIWEKRGLKVDRVKRRVCFTRDVIKELLDPYPGKGSINEINKSGINQFTENLVTERFPKKYPIGGFYPKVYDWKTKTSYLSNEKSFLEIVKAFNGLEEASCIERVVVINDYPQKIEPIMATALLIKNTNRPGFGDAYNADQIPYMIELGEISTGVKNCLDFVSPFMCVISPLKITKDECDLIIAKVKRNVPVIATIMPSSGATSPVTREGTIILELAETIAVWLNCLVLNPEAHVEVQFASSSFDMRTTQYCFSSPETVLQDCASAQITQYFLKRPVHIACNFVNAKIPGVQATYEKMFKLWWCHQFTGLTQFRVGLIDSGAAFSPVQALLDIEMLESVNAMFKADIPEQDEFDFDDFRNIVEKGTTFLESEHTFRLFKDVLYMPKLFDFSPRESDEAELKKSESFLDRIQDKYDGMIASAPDYRADEDICRSIDEVVKRAEKDLL